MKFKISYERKSNRVSIVEADSIEDARQNFIDGDNIFEDYEESVIDEDIVEVSEY